MRIFSKYILKEFIPVFFASLIVMIGIFLVNDAMQFMASLVVKGAGIWDIARVFAAGIPASFIFVVPVAFVLGWVVAVSRLAGDSEILALQSSGINPRIILKSVIASGIVVSLFLLYSNSILSPESGREMTLLVREILSRNILRLKDNTFSRIGDYIFYAGNISGDDMRDIRIYRLKNNFPETTITAGSGRVMGQRGGVSGLELENGRMFLRDSSNLNLLTSIRFEKYSFSINPMAQSGKSRSITQIKSSELRKRIKDMKDRALPSTMMELEYHMRSSLAFSAILLALLGVLIGIRLKSPKKAVGVGVAVLVVIIYYLCFTVCIHMAESGWISPFLASWIPNILCGIGILFAG